MSNIRIVTTNKYDVAWAVRHLARAVMDEQEEGFVAEDIFSPTMLAIINVCGGVARYKGGAYGDEHG